MIEVPLTRSSSAGAGARARIVATIGPVSRSPADLRALADAGVDVFRLNLSHGTHAEHGEVIRAIRRIGEETGRPFAILADLGGPKIRIGDLADGPVMLRDGEAVTLTIRSVPGGGRLFSVSYEGLPGDVRPGDRILIDDGLIELRVEGAAGEDVHCRVVHGGRLEPRKGVNLPGVRVSMPSLTEKDVRDLRFVLEGGVEYVAVSFVREAADLERVREAARAMGHEPRIVAKIEKQEAVAALPSILEASDAVMVARGDLGVEAGTEVVPIQQKRIIALANAAGVPVITATQMLESMTAHPRPTRAEASDVANAIYDGSDAVMLSGETAVGLYPIEAVRTMERIALAAEEAVREGGGAPRRFRSGLTSTSEAAVHAAVTAAKDVGARAIACYTRSGATARLVSQRRPDVAIIAFTPDESTFRRMNLYWGVTPLRIRMGRQTEDLIFEGERRLVEAGHAAKGDAVVMIAGSNTLPGATNLMKIHRMGEESATGGDGS